MHMRTSKSMCMNETRQMTLQNNQHYKAASQSAKQHLRMIDWNNSSSLFIYNPSGRVIKVLMVLNVHKLAPDKPFWRSKTGLAPTTADAGTCGNSHCYWAE